MKSSRDHGSWNVTVTRTVLIVIVLSAFSLSTIVTAQQTQDQQFGDRSPSSNRGFGQSGNNDPFSSFNSIDRTGGRTRDRDRDRDRDRSQLFDDTGRGSSSLDNPLFPANPAVSTAVRDGSRFRGQDRPGSTRFGTGGPFQSGRGDIGLQNMVIREPRYFVVAGKIVRPGQVYRVAVTIFPSAGHNSEIEVRASILRNGVDIGSDTKMCLSNTPETLTIKIPRTSVGGHYRLRVEGNDNGLVGGTAFVNETDLNFSQRSMTIFIQTDKPVYMQGQTVRFRAIPINTALRAFDDAVDVYMLDPRGNVVRRWLSRQSNFGAVSLNYTLSDQPVYGNWTIKVQALQQVEQKKFWVEEYYQDRFEVNVTTPAFFFTTDKYVWGSITANYTSGAPVYGNLTLRVSVRPINSQHLLDAQRASYDPYIENFYRDFNGFLEFRFSMLELQQRFSALDNMEVTFTAKVGEPYWDKFIDGYSRARVYNSTLKLSFLGGSPQVFKPSMPYTCYLTISYHDGSPLPAFHLVNSELVIQPEAIRSGGGGRTLRPREVTQLPMNPGIWKVTFDLKQELQEEGSRWDASIAKNVNETQALRFVATFTNDLREQATATLDVVSHYSPKNRHVRVTSSTSMPKVGEYIIFHVRGNFMMDKFSYVVMAKGIMLLSGVEDMKASIKTFAIPVSSEMAPAATIVVYHVSKYMDVVVDSLTFPVNGISRNNFTVLINNKKEKTNNVVEVVIRGQPGAWVGLSGLDTAFYTMQAGNDISYAEVLEKMITFDEDSNGTLIHKWRSREGLPDDVVYFPFHSFGIDANRTFEYSGMVVFTDIPLPKKDSYCNLTAGQYPCLTGGQCYYAFQKCNGFRECSDGTDESNCPSYNETEMIEFKLHRINRMLRLYENVWLWKDVNIGPQGHYIFTLPVPPRPAVWMISALGVSPKSGFGLIRSPIKYSGVRPLFMDVEMPEVCRHGEQVGIRVTVFNYMTKPVEAMVILSNSHMYKFVHVEAYGRVESYAPRTSQGEHQHLIWIKSQDAVQVHLPIVATELGDIRVNIQVISQIARDEVTRILRVEPDGVPQYRHTVLLLDLSSRAFVNHWMHINVTESPVIPYEYHRYYVYGSNIAEISVVGDVVGPAFPTMPVNATSLLNKPMESAEQNMFSFAANFYTLWYLRLTNQKNKDTYRGAFHNLNILLQRQLSFQNEDGSFSHFRSDWGHSPPSVYVTAYCARVFTEAIFNEWENFLYIDLNIISRAVNWLLRYQTIEGSFYEVSHIVNRKLNDTRLFGYDVRNLNVTLTSHVLIALHTVKDLPGEIGPKLNHARQRAIYYLERQLEEMRYSEARPYETALLAYALMLCKSSKADAAFILLAQQKRYEGGFAYWGRLKVSLQDYKLENNKPYLLPRLPFYYDSENIEATAYALHVYVQRQELQTDAIMKWLNIQRLHEGGWESTQDTAVAMRALIDYTIKSRIRDVTNLTVTVDAVAVPNVVSTFHLNQQNLAQPQRIKIPNAYGTVKVEARGAGYAILQLKTQYGVDRDRFITQPPVRAFDLHTRAEFAGRNGSIIHYHSCQSWMLIDESERSGMAVLEVKIPTGYFVYQPKLDDYVLSRQVRNLKRAKYYSDKVVMYFDYLDTSVTCVNFTVERWFPVANMTRYLPIRVYDYYAPERFNETIFDAFTTFTLDICQVCGSYQCPYCPIFAGTSSLVPPFVLVIPIVLLLSFRNFYPFGQLLK